MKRYWFNHPVTQCETLMRRVSDIALSDYTALGLQAALDYVSVGGGQVYVGPGTIVLTSTISISSNTWLCGAGIGATMLQRGARSLRTLRL